MPLEHTPQSIFRKEPLPLVPRLGNAVGIHYDRVAGEHIRLGELIVPLFEYAYRQAAPLKGHYFALADDQGRIVPAVGVVQTAGSRVQQGTEERDERIFDKLDKTIDKLSDLHASMATNYVSKEDCGRCKEG